MLKVVNVTAKIYIESDIPPVKNEEVIHSKIYVHSKIYDHNLYELFVQKTNIEGVYTYGSKQLFDSATHGAGYIWSSRASVINGQFNMQIEDVVLNGSYMYAMDVNLIKTLLEEYYGEKVAIEKYFPSYDKEQEEPRYRFNIVKR